MRVWAAFSLLPFHFMPKDKGSAGVLGLDAMASAVGLVGARVGQFSEAGRAAGLAAFARCEGCFTVFAGMALSGPASGPDKPCAAAAEPVAIVATTHKSRPAPLMSRLRLRKAKASAIVARPRC